MDFTDDLWRSGVMGAYAGPDISESGLVLALDAANKKSYSQNEFQYSTDIVTFSGTDGANSTITRDTISSPVGNTPLKMVVTGNDPYVSSMYNTPSDNIAPAANGQTWVASVYIKASVATVGQIFIFGAAADGNVFDAVTGQISAGGVSIGTDWTRVSYAFTFTKGISFIQVRLDGPETGGTGQTLWWDGLQVERVPSGTTTPTPFTSSYYGGSVYRNLVGSNNGTLVNYPTYNSANGGSLTFDGVDEQATFPSGPTLGITSSTSTWTVDVWFKVNNFTLPTGDNQLVGVVDTHPSTDGSSIIGYEKSGSNRIFYRGRAAASPTIITIFGPTISLSTYYNATVVRNGTTNTQLYVNAGISSTYVGDIALTTTPGLVTNSVIATFDDVNYFSSPISVSNIKIYNRALTAGEIAQNFNATRSRFGI